LVGQTSNRSAIGARLRIEFEEAGVSRSVYRWVNSGGSFGANPLRQHIGVGQAERIQSIEVLWPTTGRSQQLYDLAVDQIIEVVEGRDGFRRLDLKPASLARRSQVD
jgi:hypothetical protein